MTYHFKKALGFSLIELMVVMAIMAVVMSLSGGLFQQSINQQEKHVELEKVQQLFKQLTYKAYYQGKSQKIRIEENKLLFIEEVLPVVDVQNFSDQFSETNFLNDNQPEQIHEDYVVTQIVEFKQLLFVAQDYDISIKGIISPNEIGIFSNNTIRKLPLASIFTTND